MKPSKIIFIFITLLSANAFAGGNPVCGDSSYSNYDCSAPTHAANAQKRENRAYAGLVWTLKQEKSFIPDLTFGFRSLNVKSNDDVNGGDINGRISLSNRTLDSVRLSYVGGKRDVMGNIGAGWSVSQDSLLATAAIEGAFLKAGSDYLIDKNTFMPFMEVNSMDKPNKVQRGYGCASGAVLTPTSDPMFSHPNAGSYGPYQYNGVFDGATLNDKTCFLPSPP